MMVNARYLAYLGTKDHANADEVRDDCIICMGSSDDTKAVLLDCGHFFCQASGVSIVTKDELTTSLASASIADPYRPGNVHPAELTVSHSHVAKVSADNSQRAGH